MIFDGDLDVITNGGLSAFVQLPCVGVGEVDLAAIVFFAFFEQGSEAILAVADAFELGLEAFSLGGSVVLVFLGIKGIEPLEVVLGSPINFFNELFGLSLGVAFRSAVDCLDRGAVGKTRVSHHEHRRALLHPQARFSYNGTTPIN